MQLLDGGFGVVQRAFDVRRPLILIGDQLCFTPIGLLRAPSAVPSRVVDEIGRPIA
jgi:hypothetical protein